MHTHGFPPRTGKSNPSVLKGRKATIERGVQVVCVCRLFRTQNKKSSGEIDPRRENKALPGPVPSAVNAFVGKKAEFTVHLQGDWSIQSIGSNCLSLGPFSFHRADILKI